MRSSFWLTFFVFAKKCATVSRIAFWTVEMRRHHPDHGTRRADSFFILQFLQKGFPDMNVCVIE